MNIVSLWSYNCSLSFLNATTSTNQSKNCNVYWSTVYQLIILKDYQTSMICSISFLFQAVALFRAFPSQSEILLDVLQNANVCFSLFSFSIWATKGTCKLINVIDVTQKRVTVNFCFVRDSNLSHVKWSVLLLDK